MIETPDLFETQFSQSGDGVRVQARRRDWQPGQIPRDHADSNDGPLVGGEPRQRVRGAASVQVATRTPTPATASRPPMSTSIPPRRLELEPGKL
jgi:hypothetical protein